MALRPLYLSFLRLDRAMISALARLLPAPGRLRLFVIDLWTRLLRYEPCQP
jgi:hypothetical protein